jgi:hypothetical protein
LKLPIEDVARLRAWRCQPGVAAAGASSKGCGLAIRGDYLRLVSGHRRPHRASLGGGGDIDVDISTILDHLKMTAQGSFELRKGRWGASPTSSIWMSASRIRIPETLEINGVPIPATVTDRNRL